MTANNNARKNILVVGGAGYIGAYMCKHLYLNGYRPVVLDDLSRGHREAVQWGPLIEGSMADPVVLGRVFRRFAISAVMHFAAFSYVGESVEQPALYYKNNTANAVYLLDAMLAHDISKFIFSSTCAVYGEPREIPIPETHFIDPINPYGRSKWMVEKVLADLHAANGLKYMSLRYFNAAGADPDGSVGEDHQPETHLIPLVLQTALGQREAISVFGSDYPTADGTCIRDYIHIADLAAAHLLALEKLFNGQPFGIYNLGNGSGYSVMEVIETARRVTGRKIPMETAPRRSGDPAVLVGSSEKARRELGWEPRFAELERIIQTAWQWHRRHPRGYREDDGEKRGEQGSGSRRGLTKIDDRGQRPGKVQLTRP